MVTISSLAAIEPLKLDWVHESMQEEFIDTLLHEYWLWCGSEGDLPSLHSILMEQSHLIIDAASLFESEGKDNCYLWNEIGGGERSQWEYNNIKEKYYQATYLDLRKVIKRYRLSYVSYEHLGKVQDMQHYNLEVW